MSALTDMDRLWKAAGLRSVKALPRNPRRVWRRRSDSGFHLQGLASTVARRGTSDVPRTWLRDEPDRCPSSPMEWAPRVDYSPARDPMDVETRRRVALLSDPDLCRFYGVDPEREARGTLFHVDAEHREHVRKVRKARRAARPASQAPPSRLFESKGLAVLDAIDIEREREVVAAHRAVTTGDYLPVLDAVDMIDRKIAAAEAAGLLAD